MNKGMAKIELIAEWIFLIIWMPFSMIATMLLMLHPKNEIPLITFFVITLNIITILLQLGFFTYLIKNIKDTKKYLKQLKEDATQISIIPKKHKQAFTIGIIEYILWLFILIEITSIFSIIPNFADTKKQIIELIITYDTIFLIGNFIFLNSTYALIRLPQNKKLNRLNLICLVCSALLIILILIQLIINNPALLIILLLILIGIRIIKKPA